MRSWVAIALVAASCSSSDPGPGECVGKCDGLADGSVPEVDFCTANAGVFPEAWISGGPACGTEPAIQVQRYDRDTFILRQSLCTSAEAPFLYMLFGEDTVLLEDTGDFVGIEVPVAETVQKVIDTWRDDTGTGPVDLLVVNSHAHGDHIAHNAEVGALPNATVVGFSVAEITAFFDIPAWPSGTGSIDLGSRVIDVIPIPGHQASSIALYDHGAGLLLTGDTLYPGRLFISDQSAYRASIDRLVEVSAEETVCHVLGTHVEMTTTPGVDYEFGVTHHPDERELQLSTDHVLELQDALQSMPGLIERETHDEFIVFPL